MLSALRRALRRAVRRHYRRQLAARSEPPRILWVISHRRSGSTLLCHLLNAHPRIHAFGETGTVYRGEDDFVELAARLGRVLWKRRLDADYLVDKLVDGRPLEAPALLDHPRRIFLIREPEGCLSSTSSRLLTAGDPEPGSPAYVAALGAHYRARLAELVAYAERCQDRRHSLLVTHEELLYATSSTFAALERFLELEPGFRETYPVLRSSGRKGGDRSARIRAGRVLRGYPRPPVELPAELLAACRRRFEHCRERLGRACLGLEVAATPGSPATRALSGAPRDRRRLS